jgi:hypothetical protein
MTQPRLAAVGVVLLGLLALNSPCRADSGSTADASYGKRTDAFRRLLFELRFQPVTDFAALRAKPSESLLIVLGDPSCLSKNNFPQGLRRFVEQGGAVLIATDKKTDGEAGDNLKRLAGVTVTGETLICSSENGYGSSEYCPFVEPMVDSAARNSSVNVLGALATLVGIGNQPDLFRDPHNEKSNLRVATNAPSRLQQVRGWLLLGIHRLAQLPADCKDEEMSKRSLKQIKLLVDDRGSMRGERIEPPAEPEKPLFAVGGSIGKGRVLVLADHSIFINRMILARDNCNLEFAANCLHWLRGGISTPAEALQAAHGPQTLDKLMGERNKVLFWDDRTLRTTFDVPLRMRLDKPSPAQEPVIVAAIDRAIARWEDTNKFNDWISDALDLDDPWGKQLLLRSVLYVLTLVAGLLLAYRFLWRSRYRPLPSSVPLLAEMVGRHQPKASLLDQRRRALLRSGNVWETAHRLARECFESSGVSLTATEPRIVVAQGSRWQRWRVRRRVARLWRLARGHTPFRIRTAALQRWLRELEDLKTSLANGTIRLT